VDRGDRRHGEFEYAGVGAAGDRALADQIGVREGVALLQVGADAEGALVRGGHDDDSYAAVRAQCGAGPGDGAGHLGRHGVHGLGPVQGQLGDMTPVAVPPYGHELPEPLLAHEHPPVNAG
jgi:hypothetical protein